MGDRSGSGVASRRHRRCRRTRAVRPPTGPISSSPMRRPFLATLDPFKVYGTQAQSFFRLIFEPLFDRDPDGKIRTPLLERWGPVDRLTWEFRLRPGVRFHDGGELTAADVVYSLERILDPKVNSPRRHEFGEFETIVAIDTLTVRITTKRPYRAAARATFPVQHDPTRSAAGAFRRRVLPRADRAGPLPALGAQPEAGRAHRRSPDYHGGAPKVPRSSSSSSRRRRNASASCWPETWTS